MMCVHMMENLHQQISEIQKMEWDTFIWITDEMFKPESGHVEKKPIGEAVEPEDVNGGF